MGAEQQPAPVLPGGLDQLAVIDLITVRQCMDAAIRLGDAMRAAGAIGDDDLFAALLIDVRDSGFDFLSLMLQGSGPGAGDSIGLDI